MGIDSYCVMRLLQLHRKIANIMGPFALLEVLMRGKAGLRCVAPEEHGEPCVMTAGAPLMLA